jgi:hypothetical protein
MSDMLAKVLGEELDRMKARFYGLPPEVGSDVDALDAARAALSRPPAPALDVERPCGCVSNTGSQPDTCTICHHREHGIRPCRARLSAEEPQP